MAVRQNLPTFGKQLPVRIIHGPTEHLVLEDYMEDLLELALALDALVVAVTPWLNRVAFGNIDLLRCTFIHSEEREHEALLARVRDAHWLCLSRSIVDAHGVVVDQVRVVSSIVRCLEWWLVLDGVAG